MTLFHKPSARFYAIMAIHMNSIGLSSRSTDSTLKQEALVRALEQAWESGSPVAGSTAAARDAVAALAVRRMGSFARRGVSAQDHAGQVRDLANGLASKLEPEWPGPLIADYQWLAETLLRAFAQRARR